MAESKTEIRESTRKLAEAKASAERALEEARTAAGHGVEAGRARFGETKEQLSVGVQRGYERASTAAEKSYARTRETVGNAAESCGSYVREHPAVALSAAATAGLVIGLMIRGRNSNGSESPSS